MTCWCFSGFSHPFTTKPKSKVPVLSLDKDRSRKAAKDTRGLGYSNPKHSFKPPVPASRLDSCDMQVNDTVAPTSGHIGILCLRRPLPFLEVGNTFAFVKATSTATGVGTCHFRWLRFHSLGTETSYTRPRRIGVESGIERIDSILFYWKLHRFDTC
jgi:hypothetical protein